MQTTESGVLRPWVTVQSQKEESGHLWEKPYIQIAEAQDMMAGAEEECLIHDLWLWQLTTPS